MRYNSCRFWRARCGSFKFWPAVRQCGAERAHPRLRKLSLIACSAVLTVSMSWRTAIAQPASEPKLAPLVNESAPNRIPGQYIVVFKPGTPRQTLLDAQERVKALGGTIEHTYTSTLTGFSVKLPEGAVQALQTLRAIPGIDYIEADQKTSINTVELNPPTGLDRTSERLLPLNNRYTYSETGSGVNAYVIDTGIRVTHTDFGGRAIGAFTAINDGNGTNDCNGHGTNVAGIIGGATYGIAKQVALYAVRVFDCTANGTVSGAISGVDWVTTNAIHPAVANMSLGTGASPALDTSVTNSIASGVTYAIAAGNSNADACNTSPARVSTAITVGAIDPTNDTRRSTSNFGTCLKLFAPGVNILSAGITSDTATSTLSGTSQASPHVAGVAARYLQNHTAANPTTVWNAIHAADDVSTTAGWAGVVNPGTGSPNEVLHWGSLNDGFNDGDPHLTTVDGIHYDFQSAGEFVALREGNGLEVQTRQTPVSTAPPGVNPYTGLSVCVSINTAVAARVNNFRVTYQPKLSGDPDPSGLQLRVDGVVKQLGGAGLALGPGGRVMPSSVGSGIEIDFPDGTVLTAIPNWWASQQKWYLTVSALHTTASEGIMGAIAPGSWLPALPDHTSLGSRPAGLPQRYDELYGKFADAWRVTDKTSLFDYALGTSTATFTLRSWPQSSPPCVAPASPATKPLEPGVTERICRRVSGKDGNANCVFDVGITGEPGFAKLYELRQRIAAGATMIAVDDNKDTTRYGELATFIATVARTASGGKGVPNGVVHFTADGSKAGGPIKLDAKGQAIWRTSRLGVGTHTVAASYSPATGSVFLASHSLNRSHSVTEGAAK